MSNQPKVQSFPGVPLFVDPESYSSRGHTVAFISNRLRSFADSQAALCDSINEALFALAGASTTGEGTEEATLRLKVLMEKDLELTVISLPMLKDAADAISKIAGRMEESISDNEESISEVEKQLNLNRQRDKEFADLMKNTDVLSATERLAKLREHEAKWKGK